jgi:hypothetical protein
MKVHPFVAAATLVFVGVTALGATLVARRWAAGARAHVATFEAPRPTPRPHVFAAVWAPTFAPPQPPAAPPTGDLHVRVTGPHGLLVPGVAVTAARAGDSEDAPQELEESDDDAGAFTATALAFGRYDVVVSAPDMRPARLPVAVPGEPSVVALARAPVVRGSLGDPGAKGCSGATVKARALAVEPDVAELTEVEGGVDEADCTFGLAGPPSEGPLVVTVTWGGRIERALVTIPAVGDPAPVCFAPPCADAPASLAVYVADGAGHLVDDATIEWTLVGDDLRGELGSAMGAGFVYIHGQRPGATVRVAARVDDHEAAATVLVGAGVTEVVLTVAGGPERGVTPRAARRIRLGDGEDVGLP